MAKVFDGKAFMASKACTIQLSNGIVANVSELDDKTMKAMEDLGNNENAGLGEIRSVVATICSKQPEDLKSIGIVELRGVLDFLSENLFG